MSRRSMIAIAVLAALGVVALAIGLRGATQAGDADAERSAAVNPDVPAFTPFPAPATAGKTLDGLSVDLARLRGTPVVLNFWATWCGPCRKELPAIAAFAKAHPDIAVIGVNYQDDPSAARALAKETGASWPSIVDDGPLGAAWKVPGLPATFYIDADGKVVDRSLGEVTAQQLEDRVPILTGS